MTNNRVAFNVLDNVTDKRAESVFRRAPYLRLPMFTQTEFFEIEWTCHPSKNDATEVSRMGGKAKSKKS